MVYHFIIHKIMEAKEEVPSTERQRVRDYTLLTIWNEELLGAAHADKICLFKMQLS